MAAGRIRQLHGDGGQWEVTGGGNWLYDQWWKLVEANGGDWTHGVASGHIRGTQWCWLVQGEARFKNRSLPT